MSTDLIADSILELTAQRGPDKSICPSEVARALKPDAWQSMMTDVRNAALRLQAAGRVEILRKGKPVPAAEVRGVIRLRAASGAAQAGDAEPGDAESGDAEPGDAEPGDAEPGDAA